MKKLIPAAVLTLFAVARADAQYAAPDPAGSGPIIGAVDWLQGTLLGNKKAIFNLKMAFLLQKIICSHDENRVGSAKGLIACSLPAAKTTW